MIHGDIIVFLSELEEEFISPRLSHVDGWIQPCHLRNVSSTILRRVQLGKKQIPFAEAWISRHQDIPARTRVDRTKHSAVHCAKVMADKGQPPRVDSRLLRQQIDRTPQVDDLLNR